MPKSCEIIVYEDSGMTEKKIIEIAESKKTIKEYAFILHDRDVGEDGLPIKPHRHVFLHFGNSNVTFQYVAAWFSVAENLVSKIKSNKYKTLKYFLHEGLDKAQYDISEIKANFNVQKYFDDYEKKRAIDEIITQCAEGIITPQNYTRFIDPVTYAKHEAKLVRAWKYAADLRAAETQGMRNCRVIWIYGSSGTGKTTLCRLYASKNEKSICFSATGNDPLSQYRGEDVFVFDDLRPEIFSYADLLKILDNHVGAAIHSRYHDKVLLADTIMITTVLSPCEFVQAYNLTGAESESQLYRRITELWRVDRFIIEISEYLLDCKAWEETHRLENPISSFLDALPEKKKADSAQTLIEISKKFTH